MTKVARSKLAAEALMFDKFANIFRIPDLRKRIFFTLALLAVYRIGGHIPIPGVNSDLFRQYIEQNRGTLLGFVDLFSGGNSSPYDHLRAWHHAVHHLVDHSAVAHGCV